jgi:RND family efflux transporter MFP subunit
MADLSKVRLQANVPERDLKRLRVGATVTAHLPFQGRTLQVRVTSLFPVQDATARTGIVEAVAANPGGKLMPGQYLAMDFILAERRGVLSISRRAVFTVNGKSMAWVIKDEKASKQAIVTGLAGPERIEIISGLKLGDEVVYVGTEGLSEGQQVMRVPWGGTEAAIKPPSAAPSAKKPSGKAAPSMPGM